MLNVPESHLSGTLTEIMDIPRNELARQFRAPWLCHARGRRREMNVAVLLCLTRWTRRSCIGGLMKPEVGNSDLAFSLAE